MTCSVGHRCCSNSMLLWLWCRQAAIALIGPIVWEPPYAEGGALKSKKKKKKKKKKEKKEKKKKRKTKKEKKAFLLRESLQPLPQNLVV